MRLNRALRGYSCGRSVADPSGPEKWQGKKRKKKEAPLTPSVPFGFAGMIHQVISVTPTAAQDE